ncbi:hypothetical protein [Streptomyces sp. WMMB 322]|uniref:hypothetical protein n=1 Tax=Streptomyces sp. WMMB 322 TaxID=1286821 RepID=UPI0006E1DEA2|nr:hypothetical protein [Streptomyces sp. WMMB 322]SCK26408.1 hypothetical protein H180DRAFT_02015 [Streptomyces sp. WMMB 322]
MTIRRAFRARGRTTALAVTTGLVLAVAGCSSGDDGGDEGKKPDGASQEDGKGGTGGGSDGTGEVLAQVKGGKGGKLVLTINSAQRDDSGFTTFKGTLKNEGPSVVVLPGWASEESELKNNGLSMAGATMVDKKGKKRYFILRDTNGHCLCTRFTGGLDQGETSEWYAQFPAPPASTESVDFQVADMPSASVKLSGE